VKPPLLQTKLHIPPTSLDLVSRPRLFARLNEGLTRKLTLIAAPAGFGKTTLVSDWLQRVDLPAAWLSLDEGDNDPSRFLAYLAAAFQQIDAQMGQLVQGILESSPPPPPEAVMPAIINEIAAAPPFVLALDDYDVIDAAPVHAAITFLLDHLPPQIHVIITSRADPPLPLARLRARAQLTEVRVIDLRFTSDEAASFFNQINGLNLSIEELVALEQRTEGWIAGLQLAALALQGTISMQGLQDATSFIKSFTGSHHFVLDYLVEEVLQRQSENIQTFLLRTSILERLCGSLCDAVLAESSTSGQENLEYLEHANLFLIPLDDERRWYRFHHLFADLLRQRLQKSVSSRQHDGVSVNELHIRASRWYEENGYEAEAFHHAAAAGEVDRAARLIEGKGVPLYHRGALVPVLNWLESLPKTELDKRPALWLMYARALTTAGQTSGVEEKLQAAETALQGAELNVETRDMIGSIASNRATLAYTKYQPDTVIVQAQRALEYLSPDNLPTRAMTTLTLGVGYMQKGNRTAAIQAFTDARSISQTIGHTFATAMATMALGNMQEMENSLYLAAETQRQALRLFGDQPLPIASESHLSLARIFYEWNDLDSAQHHGERSVQLARQFDEIIDRYVMCEVFLARLKLALGDAAGAAATLAETSQSARRHNFVHRIPEVAAAQVVTFLRQGNLAAAAHLAQTYELPISQARVHLAQGDTSAALTVLEPLRRQAEAKGWEDERLKVMVLQAVAHHAHGEKDKAVQLLGDALALAEPGGFIRIFVDEGMPMAQLLSEVAAHGIMPDYVGKLLAVFEAEEQPVLAGRQASPGKSEVESYLPPAPRAQPLIEPLSQRELEVLQLMAQGLSNREISERLFLALSTVKGHNLKIFGKLQVQRRTEAIARARELGLL
jgi:LuxR family maltose regulon positive regulatory protein